MQIPYWELFTSGGSHLKKQKYLTPPGSLSIENGKPVFVRRHEMPVVSKKKIVINDKFIKTFLDDDTFEFYVTKIIKKILDNGFDVFLPIPGGLEKITTENISILRKIITNTAADVSHDKKVITNFFLADGIAKDQVYFLDIPKLTQIIFEADAPSYTKNFLETVKNYIINFEDACSNHNIIDGQMDGFSPVKHKAQESHVNEITENKEKIFICTDEDVTSTSTQIQKIYTLRTHKISENTLEFIKKYKVEGGVAP